MQIELYQKHDCPYSAKVRAYIEKNHLRDRVSYHFVDDSDAERDKLVQHTDREQVPVLVVDGKPILDSEHIIEFLKRNLVQRTEAA